MITVPDRLAPLRQALEAGQPVSVADIRRAEVLQAMDTAAIGQQFATEQIAREQEVTDFFKTLAEA